MAVEIHEGLAFQADIDIRDLNKSLAEINKKLAEIDRKADHTGKKLDDAFKPHPASSKGIASRKSL